MERILNETQIQLLREAYSDLDFVPACPALVQLQEFLKTFSSDLLFQLSNASINILSVAAKDHLRARGPERGN